MKIIFYTIFIFILFANKAYGKCGLNNNYNRSFKDDFYLTVNKQESIFDLNDSKSYKCSFDYEFFKNNLKKYYFKCSNQLIFVKTEFLLEDGVKNTWVLIDKNENTFLLKVIDYEKYEYPSNSPTDCSSITLELINHFVFDETVNYPKKVEFSLKRLYQYKVKKPYTSIPEL